MSAAVPIPELTTVRRFEAAGFRAWPAGSVHYDGTWAIRLTPGNAARRLNSVNPLDPGDVSDMTDRLERAARRFLTAGRPLTVRMSPLGAPALSAHLDALGWLRLPDSLVMRLELTDAAVEEALDQIALKNVERFVKAAVTVSGKGSPAAAALANIIDAIEPEAGLFVLQQRVRPLATAICVHDGDLAGLFEVATAAAERRKGLARRIVLSALKWARLRGAQAAWLQVEADNAAARNLYDDLGFRELYRYHYRQPLER